MFYLQDNGDMEDRVQRYREVPAKLKSACDHLASSLSSQSAQLPNGAVIHLGDIINGSLTQQQTDVDFDLVASVFEKSFGVGEIPVLHVLGNHCLAAGREVCVQRLNIPHPGYYSRELASGWRLIVLDTTEMSGHSEYPEGSQQYTEARQYEAAHPLTQENPQMSSWNGGVTSKQLAWLKQQLSEADVAGERVVVAAHHQVGLGAVRPTHMAWNWREIKNALLQSSSFRLFLAGHDHVGGYAAIQGADGRPRHFITLEAMLEAPTDSNAYGIAQFFEDIIELQGFGTVTSRQLDV